MINDMVERVAMAIICFGRSFWRSDEKQLIRTMTRAAISKSLLTTELYDAGCFTYRSVLSSKDG